MQDQCVPPTYINGGNMEDLATKVYSNYSSNSAIVNRQWRCHIPNVARYMYHTTMVAVCTLQVAFGDTNHSSLYLSYIVYTKMLGWLMEHVILLSHRSLELSVLLRVCPSIRKNLCTSSLHTLTSIIGTLSTKILGNPYKTNKLVMMPISHTP